MIHLIRLAPFNKQRCSAGAADFCIFLFQQKHGARRNEKQAQRFVSKENSQM